MRYRAGIERANFILIFQRSVHRANVLAGLDFRNLGSFWKCCKAQIQQFYAELLYLFIYSYNRLTPE